MYMKPLNSSEIAGGSRRRKNRNKNSMKKRKNRRTKNFKKNQMGGEPEGKGPGFFGKMKDELEKLGK